jgi:hypothetical protein
MQSSDHGTPKPPSPELSAAIVVAEFFSRGGFNVGACEEAVLWLKQIASDHGTRKSDD